MALTVPIIVDRVLSRLAESGVQSPIIDGPEIETWIPEGLYRVALKNSNAKEFQKIVTGVSITSGSLTVADTTLILDSLPMGSVRVGSTPAFFAPNYDALRASVPATDSYWYTIEGNTLQFKNTDGTLGSASGTATLVGVAIPTLANLHARYESALIEELVLIGLSAIRKEVAA